MTDRPILFSAPMVRALLAGTKTQTRRVLKPMAGLQCTWLTTELLAEVPSVHMVLPGNPSGVPFGVQLHHPAGAEYGNPTSPLGYVRSPYGGPGDVLWVRETICIGEDLGEDWEDWMEQGDRFALYPAGGGRDKDYCVPADYEVPRNAKVEHHGAGTAEHWRQFGPIVSIHMPRWASRISLRITDVRVERLNEISEADAKAEGLIPTRHDTEACWKWSPADLVHYEFASSAYRALWEKINGENSWKENPWVWVVAFEVVR